MWQHEYFFEWLGAGFCCGVLLLTGIQHIWQRHSIGAFKFGFNIKNIGRYSKEVAKFNAVFLVSQGYARADTYCC